MHLRKLHVSNGTLHPLDWYKSWNDFANTWINKKINIGIITPRIQINRQVKEA